MKWLHEQQASSALIEHLAGLVCAHEWGGSPEADLLQAADSVSFFETTASDAWRWIGERRYSRDRTEEQLDWMLDRIREPKARQLALPFYEAAVRGLRLRR